MAGKTSEEDRFKAGIAKTRHLELGKECSKDRAIQLLMLNRSKTESIRITDPIICNMVPHEMIRSMPLVKSFSMDYSAVNIPWSTPFPSLVLHVLSFAKLQNLSLCQVDLSNPPKIPGLCPPFWPNPNLQFISLSQVRGLSDEHLKVLGNHAWYPNLKAVEIHGFKFTSEPGIGLTKFGLSKSIAELAQNPSLRRLDLQSEAFYDDPLPIRSLATALDYETTTSQLQFLRIAAPKLKLKSEEVEHIGQMLFLNKTLEALYLSVDESLLMPIVLALGCNRTLKILSTQLEFNDNEDSRKALPISEYVQDMLCAMLRGNDVLRYLHTKAPYCSDVAFYLRLNRAGRRHLLNAEANIEEDVPPPTQSDWVNAVLDFQKETDVVFYLLSHNPSIVDISNVTLPQYCHEEIISACAKRRPSTDAGILDTAINTPTKRSRTDSALQDVTENVSNTARDYCTFMIQGWEARVVQLQMELLKKDVYLKEKDECIAKQTLRLCKQRQKLKAKDDQLKEVIALQEQTMEALQDETNEKLDDKDRLIAGLAARIANLHAENVRLRMMARGSPEAQRAPAVDVTLDEDYGDDSSYVDNGAKESDDGSFSSAVSEE